VTAAGFQVAEHTAASARHTTGYLACGREHGRVPAIWPV
jgi:hypothetical protein